MKKTKFSYKGYKIELCSYQLAGSKKWVPKVLLYKDKLDEVTTTPLFWEKELKTRDEADKYAITQAKMYIEKHLE